MLVGFPFNVPGSKRHFLADAIAGSTSRLSAPDSVASTSPTVPSAKTSTFKTAKPWTPWQLCPALQSGFTKWTMRGGTTCSPAWLDDWASASPVDADASTDENAIEAVRPFLKVLLTRTEYRVAL